MLKWGVVPSVLCFWGLWGLKGFGERRFPLPSCQDCLTLAVYIPPAPIAAGLRLRAQGFVARFRLLPRNLEEVAAFQYGCVCIYIYKHI